MEKEQEPINNSSNETEENTETENHNDPISENEKKDESTPEDKIKELEDKLSRTLAEMENQRRRFEKEKEDAFEYGGFLFAKEALNLIDNLDRSKQALENDEKLKDTEALQKILDHLKVVNKELISIFNKNNIKQITIETQKGILSLSYTHLTLPTIYSV